MTPDVLENLVPWLRAQFDEDERTAQAATPGPWLVDCEYHAESIIAGDGTSVITGGRWDGEASAFESTQDALHIARHNPARVLREIDTKRRVMQVHNARDSWGMCVACPRDERGAMKVEIEDCPILRALALPYADRPGYREEWRP